MVIVGEADEEYVRKTLRVGKVLGFSRSNNRQATRRLPPPMCSTGGRESFFPRSSVGKFSQGKNDTTLSRGVAVPWSSERNVSRPGRAYSDTHTGLY